MTLADGADEELVTQRRREYAPAMAHVLVTPEPAAFLRQRLQEKFAELQAAKADFASICERIGAESRSSFGKFVLSFDEVVRECAPTRYNKAQDDQ